MNSPSNHWLLRGVSVALFVLLTACLPDGPGGPGGPSEPAPAGTLEVPDLPRHQLVFSHHSDAARKDYDLWWMCGDGSQMASLVVEPEHQLQVTLSPDGEQFVYPTLVDGARDLVRRSFRRGAREDAVNLTNHPAEDSQPAWSPDGQTIAFFSNRDAEKLELYLLHLNEDGSPGRVERKTENSWYDSGAAWSPDGSRIVFTRYFPAPDGADHGGNGEIVQLDLASSEETQLTDLGGYNGGLSYSPDGARIAFHRVHDERAEIWLIQADGSEPHPITDTFIDEYSPEWSPDGQWIAFAAGVGNDGLGTFDLWLMRPDGSHRLILNRAGNTEAWHKWRPGENYCR